jgi:hypothetical protein
MPCAARLPTFEPWPIEVKTCLNSSLAAEGTRPHRDGYSDAAGSFGDLNLRDEWFGF